VDEVTKLIQRGTDAIILSIAAALESEGEKEDE
jgi:hypothetical protein